MKSIAEYTKIAIQRQTYNFENSWILIGVKNTYEIESVKMLKDFILDKTLQKINISQYDVISFDIFDTLLFRLTSKPEDIFFKIGVSAKEILGRHFFYSPKIFQKLRIKAEFEARKKSLYEDISLEEIYEELPVSNEQKKFLIEKEIELETKYTYKNDRIYSLLKYCVTKNKKVILISDMYLSKKHIRSLLANAGIDLSFIDKIFVSSEHRLTKNSGNLYNKVRSYYGIETKFLHIGDNSQSDVLSAQKSGFDSIHYQALVEDMASIYKMEDSFVDEEINLGELRSLRKLIGHSSKYRGDELRWYKIGAEILGPVYTIFAEWVVDFANKKGIQTILPFMREGMLFSKLINNIVDKEKHPLNVQPLYISRKATYLPSLEQITEEQLNKLLQKHRLTVKNLFSLLGLKITKTTFEKDAHYKIEQLEKNKQDELLGYLIQPNIMETINENIKNQRKYFKEYLKKLSRNRDFITVDFGFQGTMQSVVSSVLFENTQSVFHLLVVAGNEAINKLYNGNFIFPWLGYELEKKEAIETIVSNPEIIEALTNIAEGSTEKYIEINNDILPIKEEYEFPEKHKRIQSICWEGIFDFQKEWLNFKHRKELLPNLFDKKDGFLAVFQRLILYPLPHEAKSLGKLIQHENFNFSRSTTIVREEDFQWLDKMGVEEFLNKTKETFFPYEIYWPQGVVELRYPNYFTKLYMLNSMKDSLIKKTYRKLSEIDKNKYKCISIYGAGELGLKVLGVAKLLDINISFFIDRNYKQIKELNNIQVNSLEAVSELTDLIIIASIAFENEIVRTIESFYGEKKPPKIIVLN